MSTRGQETNDDQVDLSTKLSTSQDSKKSKKNHGLKKSMDAQKQYQNENAYLNVFVGNFFKDLGSHESSGRNFGWKLHMNSIRIQ